MCLHVTGFVTGLGAESFLSARMRISRISEFDLEDVNLSGKLVTMHQKTRYQIEIGNKNKAENVEQQSLKRLSRG